MFFVMPPRRQLNLKDYLTPGSSYHFATVEVDRPVCDHRHCHDFFEIFWVESGQGAHAINGEERALTPGAAFFVRPEDFHDIRADRGQALRLANVAFSRHIHQAVARRHAGLAALFSGDAESREIRPGVLDRLFLAEGGKGLLHGHGELLAIDRFLLNLTFELQHSSHGAEPMPDWLERTLQLCSDPHLFHEGPPAFYREAGRSVEHVIRETRRWTGLTPTALITRERMRFAAGQLSTTNRSITDIAADCGLENLSHFYRVFRDHHGCAPRQFRLRRQGLALGRPFAR